MQCDSRWAHPSFILGPSLQHDGESRLALAVAAELAAPTPRMESTARLATPSRMAPAARRVVVLEGPRDHRLDAGATSSSHRARRRASPAEPGLGDPLRHARFPAACRFV